MAACLAICAGIAPLVATDRSPFRTRPIRASSNDGSKPLRAGWTTGICVGAEALIQWRCPGGKWIEPDSFLPLAEEAGLIVGISNLLIERVVEDLTERPASSSTLQWK